MGFKNRRSRQRPAAVPIGRSRHHARKQAARALGPRVGAGATAFQIGQAARREAGKRKLGNAKVRLPSRLSVVLGEES